MWVVVIAVIKTIPNALRDKRVVRESDCLGAIAEYLDTPRNPTIWTRPVEIDIAYLVCTRSVYLICVRWTLLKCSSPWVVKPRCVYLIQQKKAQMHSKLHTFIPKLSENPSICIRKSDLVSVAIAETEADLVSSVPRWRTARRDDHCVTTSSEVLHLR